MTKKPLGGYRGSGWESKKGYKVSKVVRFKSRKFQQSKVSKPKKTKFQQNNVSKNKINIFPFSCLTEFQGVPVGFSGPLGSVVALRFELAGWHCSSV